jgi:hypothetical protein
MFASGEEILPTRQNYVNNFRSVRKVGPISPASEMVWWGARDRRVVTNAVRSPVSLLETCGLNGFSESQLRQDGGEPPGQHRRVGACGADEE